MTRMLTHLHAVPAFSGSRVPGSTRTFAHRNL
jgi:hypothetical protein